MGEKILTYTELAERFHKNSVLCIDFIEEVARKQPIALKLNLKIYNYLKIVGSLADHQVGIINFLDISMKAAAKDLEVYRTPDDLPIIAGKSRYPYWENVRTKNIAFFVENVVMLIPKIDLKKINSWKMVIPDLQFFTKDNIESEIRKLLSLFDTTNGLNPTVHMDDIDELWDFLTAYIKDAIRYVKATRGLHPTQHLHLDIPTEAKLFDVSDIQLF
jgi:hypothetical protein